MMDFSEMTVCVLDCGLHIGMAEHLAREGWKKVIYVNRWQASYSYSTVHDVGEGLRKVKVYDSVASTIENDRVRWRDPEEYDGALLTDPAVDLFICMDLGYSDDTKMLRSLGYRVFGNAMAEQLEYDRVFAKERFIDDCELDYMKDTYEVVPGSKLRDYIVGHKGTVYVKGTSKVRGDMESRRIGCIDDLDDWLRSDIHPYLGSKFDDYQFVVEKAMDNIVEMAFDSYLADGISPTRGLIGIEQKGAGYMGCFGEVPDTIRDLNVKLEPYLKMNGGSGFMSIETLYDRRGRAFPTDPCMRGGMPCNGSIQLCYSNLSEAMYKAAEGELIEPKAAHKYSAEYVIMSSSHSEQSVPVPPRLAPNVRIVNCKRENGSIRWMPQPHLKPTEGLAVIGTVIGTGNTANEAKDMAAEIADEITSGRTNLEYDEHALDKISDSFKKLRERGVI